MPRRVLGVCGLLGWFVFACGSPASDEGGDEALDGDASTSDAEASDAGTADADASDAGTTETGSAGDIVEFALAQTHVLPGGVRRWQLGEAQHELHLTGRRAALLAIEASDPSLELEVAIFHGDEQVETLPLAPPAALPGSEADGPALSEVMHSAEIPGELVVPGMSLRVRSTGPGAGEVGAPIEPVVGADIDFQMITLPFYLFGADDDNSAPIEQTGVPDVDAQIELFAKWPVAEVEFRQHPAERVRWDSIIVGPRNDGPATRVEAKDEQGDGFAVMSAVLDVLGALREANGDGPTNNQYYAPLLMLTSGGEYEHPGGGLGGGHLGTGDFEYAGIFIHEQGHAFGMPHAADAYADGAYPYVGGSLAGSSWGYDAMRAEFLPTFIPSTAESAAGCADDDLHQLDGRGRCIKQDPMQSGSGDQDPSYRYTMFSDFNASVIQRYFEGITTLDRGTPVYEGGRIFVDASSPSGYSRWDTLEQARVEVAVETTDNALYGFDAGLPSVRDVPVHAIVVTISGAGTPGITQIYPPLSFVGNLRRVVDPSDAEQLAAIEPDVGDNPWYCHASGCDYTLRVTYEGGEIVHVLLRTGFRPWFGPEDPVEASSQDPLDGNSYRALAVNVPGDDAITKVELLATPMGWLGLPDDPSVLATWQ